MPKLKSEPSTSSSDSPYLVLEEAALFLRLNPRTLDNMRTRGVGPIYCKHGGRVVYHRDDLDTWSKSSRRHSSGERAREVPAARVVCSDVGADKTSGAIREGLIDQPHGKHAARDLSPAIVARSQSR